MMIGRVAGTAVSTNKSDSLTGAKLLIVVPIDIATMQEKNDYMICVDDVGAGEGDIVMCAYGSSARQTETSAAFASDYSIYAVVDHITIEDKKSYDRSGN